MRVFFAAALLVIGLATQVFAITDNSFRGEVRPPVEPDLKWLNNGRLLPVSEIDFLPFEMYDIKCTLLKDGEELSSFSCLAYAIHPTVISARNGSIIPMDEQSEVFPNSFVTIRSKWDEPLPLNMVSPDLEWLNYWDACNTLQLKNLRFDIYYPQADYAKISVNRMVRPPAVVDDRQGDVIFEMHHPREGEPEFYGVIEAPLEPKQHQASDYVLEVTASSAGTTLAEFSLNLTDGLSTEFAINPEQLAEPTSPYPAAITGVHAANARHFGPHEKWLDEQDIERLGDDLQRMRMGGFTFAFLDIMYSFFDADEIVFELYEAGDGIELGQLVERKVHTYRDQDSEAADADFGIRAGDFVTRAPFGN